MFGNIINSIFLILIIPLLALSIILWFNEKRTKFQIKRYIEKNGIETQAEILGYHKHTTGSYQRHNKSTTYFTIFKFRDINGIEHITMDTSSRNTDIKYNVGDIVTIKYIENELIDNQNLKSKILKRNFDIEKYNQVESQVLVDTPLKSNLHKGYFSKLDEDINITDNSNVYSTIFKTRSTKSAFTDPFLILVLLILSPAIIVLGYLLIGSLT